AFTRGRSFSRGGRALSVLRGGRHARGPRLDGPELEGDERGARAEGGSLAGGGRGVRRSGGAARGARAGPVIARAHDTTDARWGGDRCAARLRSSDVWRGRRGAGGGRAWERTSALRRAPRRSRRSGAGPGGGVPGAGRSAARRVERGSPARGGLPRPRFRGRDPGRAAG